MAYEKVPRPSTVYHLTQKGNLDSILDDGMIRRFNDTECWFCESLDKMKAYMEQTVMCKGNTLELTLCKGDGSEESWSYQLNAAEQDVLLRKMEEYCQQQTGMSLHDYAQQFREEPEQQQGPVMKL